MYIICVACQSTKTNTNAGRDARTNVGIQAHAKRASGDIAKAGREVQGGNGNAQVGARQRV